MDFQLNKKNIKFSNEISCYVQESGSGHTMQIGHTLDTAVNCIHPWEVLRNLDRHHPLLSLIHI